MLNVKTSDFDKIVASAPTVLVDFHAAWCQPCKALEPTLAAIDGNPIPVVKVDVDAEPDLAVRFGIMSVPTLVLIKNGEPIDKRTGTHSEGALRSWIDKAAA